MKNIFIIFVAVSLGCETSTPQEPQFTVELKKSTSQGFEILVQTTSIEKSVSSLLTEQSRIADEQTRIADALEVLQTRQTVEETKQEAAESDAYEEAVAAEETKTEAPVIADESDYVVEFRTKTCGGCVLWSNREAKKLKKAGVRVVEVDVELPENEQWAQYTAESGVPQIWVVDGKTRTRKKAYVGYVSGEILLQQIQNPQPTNSTEASSCRCSSACVCGCQSGGVCRCGQIQQTQIQQPQPITSVLYDGVYYSARVCDNLGCYMCNQIEAGLLQNGTQYQSMSIKKSNPGQEPTPSAVIKEELDILDLSEDDVLYEPGCGDARVLIEAAKRFGCSGIGVEIDPEKADEARKKVGQANLNDKITIITGDVLNFDHAGYGVTAISVYQYPDLLQKMMEAGKFDGVDIVTSPFHLIPGLDMKREGDVYVYLQN